MNANAHTRTTTHTTATRSSRRAPTVAQLRKESFIWFRYARFIGMNREAAVMTRADAIDFSKRLRAQGFVIPAEIEVAGCAIAEDAFKARLKQDGLVEILLRYRTEQDGLDTHEYVCALIDIRPHEAALTLGRLDGDATRWLAPLLRDWKPLRAFVVERAGTRRVVIADVPAAAQDWLDSYEDRKAAHTERIRAAISDKAVAPVYIRRRTGNTRGYDAETGGAEARLQKLYDALGKATKGSHHANGLQVQIDTLRADILHRRHRALAAQDTELAYLPTVEDWLREETWARDEAGPHRPVYLDELRGSDRRGVAAYC